MEESLFALFIALLAWATIPLTSAWQPLKGTFSLPISTFPDTTCGPNTTASTSMQSGPFSIIRSGICFNHGSSAPPIGSFVYGHEFKGKKSLKAEKRYPVCSLEVYEHEFCGGERRDYVVGGKHEGEMPGFPVYVVNGATHPDNLRKCYSLGEAEKKGRSMLMTCKFVNDREFPNCRHKSVSDDAAHGLLRACYTRGIDPKVGTSDAEDWCKPHCGTGWPKPVHQPGYGPQCKDPVGNCKVGWEE